VVYKYAHDPFINVVCEGSSVGTITGLADALNRTIKAIMRQKEVAKDSYFYISCKTRMRFFEALAAKVVEDCAAADYRDSTMVCTRIGLLPVTDPPPAPCMYVAEC
jgi:hypothetical protein